MYLDADSTIVRKGSLEKDSTISFITTITGIIIICIVISMSQLNIQKFYRQTINTILLQFSMT